MLRVEAGNTNTTALGWTVRTPAGVRSLIWRFVPGQLAPWTHVAGTYDGRNLALYINGQPVGSTPHLGALVDTSDTFRIGNGDLSAPGIEEWNGDIDEVRLWPFARTAAEIQSTMNLELTGVPGEVSTWNLNNTLADTSGGNHGQAVNAPSLLPNTLSLMPVAFAGINFGTPTAGCSGPPRAVATVVPAVGNADFAVGAVRASVSGAGILWLGTRALPTPLRVLGVDLWIDPTVPSVQVSVPGNTLGFTRVPLPIPNDRFLANRSLVFQSVWTEPGCATALFASDGLQFVIRP